MAMRTHPPTGPRAGRNNEASRFTRRGGVQKRGQQTVRVDNDGDLDMDFNGVGRGRGRGRGAEHRRGTLPLTNGHGNPFRDSRRNKVDLSAVQKGVFRIMGEANKGSRLSLRNVKTTGQTAGGMDKPAAGGLDQILIRGLRQSKAASNADGGLESLLSWLERKATGPNGESVRVKKVCLTLYIAGSPYRRSFAYLVRSRFMPSSQNDDRDIQAMPHLQRDLQLQGYKPC